MEQFLSQAVCGSDILHSPELTFAENREESLRASHSLAGVQQLFLRLFAEAFEPFQEGGDL
jgi:hypothetical protein